jgi:phosphoglycolate phosphatase-like HAD superfamily hydrolase
MQPWAMIFDVEGTLVDSVSSQLESWRVTLNEAGHSFSYADLQPYSGMDGEWMLAELLPALTQDDRKGLLKAQGDLYRGEFLRRVQPFPAVRQLFEVLAQNQILIGIGTTCQKDELAIYDERLNILELTDVIACAEMVKHGKPDPSLFRTCLAQLKVLDASTALAVGDSPFDAQAARQIGMRSAGVTTGGFSPRALLEAGCEAVFEGVGDLARLFQQTRATGLLTPS